MLHLFTALASDQIFALLNQTYFHVLGSIIGEPLVHLIADAHHVVLDAQVSDQLQLLCLVHLRVGDHNQPGTTVHTLLRRTPVRYYQICVSVTV